MVWPNAAFHCAAFSFNANPERTAATNTPVPAAESQLIVNRAASGFALMGAIGGIRCTRLCSAGISQTGSESVPPNVDPSSVVVNLMSAKMLFKYFLNSGTPHMAQQRMRMAHGSHAYIVCLAVYLYF